ncbi:MAG: hypothetical protein N3F04_03470 [Candidatus Nezhaarchaeota archaeon]|nr:hypothetical protein [Candidatus Nezhaarchaeota archaeon]MCX8141823.1 hypothetical protein [Candidatus Nezhaarchaeota archaeon]MDW8050396.1 hypothetical protein [Nitrososphaerota archaeon]
MKRLGLLTCLLITLAIGVVLELTEYWQLLTVAGVVGGLLARSFKVAAISGFLGLLIAWGVYFLTHYVMLPTSFAVAYSYLSMLLGIGLVLVALLGLFSALLGYFLSKIVMKRARPLN